MTIYNHTVTLPDVEIIALENLINDAINKFKADHAEDGLPVPWVWESILEKLRNAHMTLLSTNNFAQGGNTIFINIEKPE